MIVHLRVISYTKLWRVCVVVCVAPAQSESNQMDRIMIMIRLYTPWGAVVVNSYATNKDGIIAHN